MPKTLIIAEAGVNHNGSMDLACKLIDAAKAAGADIVKFQTFKATELVSRYADKAIYQKSTTDANETQFEMIKKLELSKDQHQVLMQYCIDLNIEFLSAPFDLDSIRLLHELGVKRFKIPSGEITNYLYLRTLAAYNKPVIMSTGMATLKEIQEALEVLTTHGTELKRITVLHCNTEYPTPFEDVNLKALETMRRELRVPVGYSDHTRGIEVPIAAVALGASVLEKHFTLDRTLPGPDHKASLEPGELTEMVRAIRHIENAMGDGNKQPSPSETNNMVVARKSIVAARVIKKGEVFSLENITAKRPGNGISPMRLEEIMKQKASRDYGRDEQIELNESET